MRTACLIVAILLLAGCDLYAKHQAKDQVRDVLRDPGSAQFSEWRIAGNGLLACGKVNAKNGMGGYTGKRTFVIWAEDGVAIAPDEMESMRYETCCILLESAVKSHRDSSEIEGYGRACKDVAKNHFSW